MNGQTPTQVKEATSGQLRSTVGLGISMGVLLECERCGAQIREQGADTGFETRYLISVKHKNRTPFKMPNDWI